MILIDFCNLNRFRMEDTVSIIPVDKFGMITLGIFGTTAIGVTLVSWYMEWIKKNKQNEYHAQCLFSRLNSNYNKNDIDFADDYYNVPKPTPEIDNCERVSFTWISGVIYIG